MAAALFEPITADLQVRLLHPGAVAPRRAHGHDAGYDLACVEDFTLWPARRRTVGTGVAIALPPGVAGLVTPRSGLAARHGITIVNAPGLVDPGYRGELRVTLLNTGDAPHAARAGDRIAQLVLIPFVAPEVHVVEDLDGGPDARGELGFGSSGRCPARSHRRGPCRGRTVAGPRPGRGEEAGPGRCRPWERRTCVCETRAPSRGR